MWNRIKGDGHTSQIYATHQSIAKAFVAFYQKYVDEQIKEIKGIPVRCNRTLLVVDSKRYEPKKFDGHDAHAMFQKPWWFMYYGQVDICYVLWADKHFGSWGLYLFAFLVVYSTFCY